MRHPHPQHKHQSFIDAMKPINATQLQPFIIQAERKGITPEHYMLNQLKDRIGESMTHPINDIVQRDYCKARCGG